MERRRPGFTLIELLVVLIAGSLIIAALVSTLVSVLRGSSGLMHYSDMKQQSDRLLSYFSNDVFQADSLEFTTPETDEQLAFSLFSEGSLLVTYSYGLDSSPPAGLTGSIFCIYREPSSGSRYEIATGFMSPPTERISGVDTASFFFFLNRGNEVLNHTTATGKTLTSRAVSKIRLNGTMERGGSGDFPITHEVSTLSVLKNQVIRNTN